VNVLIALENIAQLANVLVLGAALQKFAKT